MAPLPLAKQNPYIAITLSLLIAIVVTALFGSALSLYFPDITESHGAIQMLLMAGTGWVVQIILSSILLSQKNEFAQWLKYVQMLGKVMVVGVLILVPSILWRYTTGELWVGFPAISVLISSLSMLYLHIQGINNLRLPFYYNMTWFAALQITALAWVTWFHLLG